MPFIIQKYGGSSIGTIEKIKKVANKIIESKKNGNDIVVVVSAMQGETNRLTELAKSINVDASGRELDTLLSTGEQVTIALLSLAISELGLSLIHI